MKETGFFVCTNDKKLSAQEKPMKKQSNESNVTNQLVEIKKCSPPKLPKSPPPLILTTQSSGLANDSSDDEVKDYLTHKETINYDEISHV